MQRTKLIFLFQDPFVLRRKISGMDCPRSSRQPHTCGLVAVVQSSVAEGYPVDKDNFVEGSHKSQTQDPLQKRILMQDEECNCS